MENFAPEPWRVVADVFDQEPSEQWFGIVDGHGRLLAEVDRPDVDGHETGVPQLARLLACSQLMYRLLEVWFRCEYDSDGIGTERFNEIKKYIHGQRALPPVAWPL